MIDWLSIGSILGTGLAVLTVSILLNSSLVKKAIHAEQTKNEPVQALLKQMGMRGHITDLNKLTPQAFQMLRQLIYDFRQYDNPSGGKTSSTASLIQALTALNSANKPQQTQTQNTPIPDITAQGQTA